MESVHPEIFQSIIQLKNEKFLSTEDAIKTLIESNQYPEERMPTPPQFNRLINKTGLRFTHRNPVQGHNQKNSPGNQPAPQEERKS